jgi:helicase
MKPTELEIPREDKATIAELMQTHGFDSLKKTQAFAFENGILEEGNNILVAETGNGKTLTAEACTLKELKNGGRVAYLVPSNQLVWSKKETIEEWAEPEYRVYSGDGKYRSADVAVATFESFYRAILRGVDGARSFDCIVLDDFHELYSDFRGAGIELAISAALDGDSESASDTKIYGISATLGNPDELGDWMDADVLVSPEDRQTPIEQHAIDAGTSSTKDAIINTIRQNPEKNPYLVFCFAKSWTESRAKALADAGLFDGPDRDLRSELSDRVDGVLTKTHREILQLLRNGVAYIHADLPGRIKQYILDLYENEELQAICTTTSLAYGFDSPVQTVIVADIKRRGEYVGVYEYIQWEGRSARPKFGYERGYAYTLADDPKEVEERFFEPDRELEPVQTHIDGEEQFQWVVLELIANGWETVEQIESFLKNTLYWEQLEAGSDWRNPDTRQSKAEELRERVRETSEWLADEGFISERATADAYSTTALGRGAVEFHYGSFVDAPLTSVKSFYTWAENDADTDTTQLDYLYRTIETFEMELAVQSITGPVETAIRNWGYDTTSAGITAGVLRWYWMRNYSPDRIEEEAEIDPTYLPGLARKVSDAVRATKYLVKAAPNANLPEWHENLVYRTKKGVREDAIPLVSEIDAVGRARVRLLREYMETMERQTLELGRGNDLWTLLCAFYEYTDNGDQFQSVLRDQVSMVGGVTASNIGEFVEENQGEITIESQSTDEETALVVSGQSSSSNATRSTTNRTTLQDF